MFSTKAHDGSSTPDSPELLVPAVNQGQMKTDPRKRKTTIYYLIANLCESCLISLARTAQQSGFMPEVLRTGHVMARGRVL